MPYYLQAIARSVVGREEQKIGEGIYGEASSMNSGRRYTYFFLVLEA